MQLDRGNPNVFRTFKGRYFSTLETPENCTSAAIMLSCTNDVIFTGDYISDDEGLICILPDECRPEFIVKVPCVTFAEHQSITITSEGEVLGEPQKTYFLNGISFNISANFYKGDNDV